jgi:hypothetical protein
MIEPLNQRAQLAERCVVLFSKFEQHSGVRDLRFEMLLPVNFLFEPAALLQLLLGQLLVVPEVWRRGLGFDEL